MSDKLTADEVRKAVKTLSECGIKCECGAKFSWFMLVAGDDKRKVLYLCDKCAERYPLTVAST